MHAVLADVETTVEGRTAASMMVSGYMGMYIYRFDRILREGNRYRERSMPTFSHANGHPRPPFLHTLSLIS